MCDEEIVAVLIVVTFFFGLGAYIGYQVGLPTKTEKEIITKACEYIYENESLEVYTKYCK